ncbi:isochorismatase family protein [Paracoccus sp. 11-3]|uniref:Isochorismatase family protein n=1 Tax=Paracoccus amoyensis TaxID=2760093 RepID=A0A926JDD2_9RHOB|nr:isochorismatase family protein [Paracoccus amoyensis]MBC9247464.1 isochorismatase family protein [Paracoccus amoyensis]
MSNSANFKAARPVIDDDDGVMLLIGHQSGMFQTVAAVKETVRKTLIIAGTITSACMAFPAISAISEGYKVFVVIGASGTHSKMAEDITQARVVQRDDEQLASQHR